MFIVYFLILPYLLYFSFVGTSGGGVGGTPIFSQNLKFVIFQKIYFYLVAYDPDIKLKTFSMIFDVPEGRVGHAHFPPKFLIDCLLTHFLWSPGF